MRPFASRADDERVSVPRATFWRTSRLSMTDGTFTCFADEFVAQGLATRGTMMGHPCLRANGAYFASGGHAGDAIVVKLPEARGREEIEAGRGAPFAPAGRPFKQWMEVVDERLAYARERLFEALEFVAG